MSETKEESAKIKLETEETSSNSEKKDSNPTNLETESNPVPNNAWKTDFSRIKLVKTKFDHTVLANQLPNPNNVQHIACSILKTVEIGIDDNHVYLGGYDSYPVIVIRIDRPNWADFLVGHSDCTFCIKTNRKKKITISGARDGSLIFWGVYFEGGEMKHKLLHRRTDMTPFILSMRITEDGEKVFINTQESDIKMISTTTYKTLRVFPQYNSTFNDQFFSINAKGTIIAGVNQSNSSSLKTHFLEGKRPKIINFGNKNANVGYSHFVERFRTMVFVSGGSWINFISFKTKKVRLRVHAKVNVKSFAYSDERRVLGAGLEIGIMFFQFQKNGSVLKLVFENGLDYPNQSLAMSVSGNRYISCQQATVTIVDCEYEFEEGDNHNALED